MTFEHAVSLYNDAVNSKPSDYLFEGKENRRGVLEAIEDMFDIRVAVQKSICERCIHLATCPFCSTYDELYERCNFHKEAP